MEATIRSALRHGVAIGAHPGYPDRARFGRVALELPAEEVGAFVLAQLRALCSVAARHGARIAHVKPHGALYHEAMRAGAVARALANAAREAVGDTALFGFAGSPALSLWQELGFRVVAEAFADRRYEADGSLRDRTHADALLTDPRQAAAQALTIARRERGTLEADSICIHGDTPGAAALARTVRARLEEAGFRIGPHVAGTAR
jgi:5-oxoprolinase (ATP-hydrolysing) subunit A